MTEDSNQIIGITMGDPSGIGPEIILKCFCLNDISRLRIIVLGDYDIMTAANRILKTDNITLKRIEKVSEALFSDTTLNILDLNLIDIDKFQPGTVNKMSGNAAFGYIRKAIELANNHEITGIATAPLNKEALHLAGHDYPGHTEILSSLTNTADYAMLLHDSQLSVIHVSTHISLLEAIKGLRKERIEKVIELADRSMKQLGCSQPAIGVAGINPHAGENGLFGDEETREIIPAVRAMKDRGFNVYGPLPPDTVFLQALNGKYDIVVAMYHDQGHIPLKLIGFKSGVNITAGLPFIRTSVDHGTAFEIAWQGKADESSMAEAVRLAFKLSSHTG